MCALCCLDEAFVGIHSASTQRTVSGRPILRRAPVLQAALTALVLAAARPVNAADPATLAAPPPGAVPQFEALRPQPAIKDNGTAVPDQPAPPRELGKPADDITMDVSRYVVDDNAPASLKAALPQLTEPFTGKGRSYEDLVNAVAAVTRYLQRDMGLYLGYAYLPEQKPEDGAVRIAVLEGRLDEIILNWRDDIPVDKSVVEAHLARLRSGDVLRVKDVERVVFLLNDLRGLTARFEIKQGRYPGTASLVVTPMPEAKVSGKAEFDANGSRYSGIYRVGATANIASPFRRGDGLVLSGQTTTTGGLKFLLAGYTLPVGNDGLKIGTSISHVQYQLSDDVPLDLHGTATAVTGYAIYPVVRSRNLNMFAQLSIEQREFLDQKGDLAGADIKKRARELRIGVAGDFRDNLLTGGVNTYEAALTASEVVYRETPTPIVYTYPTKHGRLNLGFSRLQNILSNRLLAYFSFSGQWANRNLDTTEQFGVGGPGRVRAFAPGEGTGDIGQVASLELRVLPPEAWFGRFAREMVFSTFYDWGHVTYRYDTAGQLTPNQADSATFSGYGIGATWDRPQQFGARLSLAWPITGTPQNDTVKRSPRVYATLTKYF